MGQHAPAPTTECPSCGWPSSPTCAHCGYQRGPGTEGRAEERLRAWFDRPATEADVAGARRFLDRLAEHRSPI